MEEDDTLKDHTQQLELNEVGIGDTEVQKLTAKPVTITKAGIEEVGEKKIQKVVCTCKHPDANDPIDISSVKYESKGKLMTSGLWFNQDEDKKIQKGSALAKFLVFSGAMNLKALEGRQPETSEDERGYLCFKAY